MAFAPGITRGACVERTAPTDLSLRRCESRDAADLWILFNDEDYQRSGALTRFDDPEAVACWLAAHRSGNFEIVGVCADAVVGFAGLYPFPGRQSHAGQVSLGVRKPFQGCGYGRVLLRAILATADRLAGLSRVQLNVLVDNARAIALYRSCDFVIEGRHLCFAQRDAQFVDAFTMARMKP